MEENGLEPETCLKLRLKIQGWSRLIVSLGLKKIHLQVSDLESGLKDWDSVSSGEQANQCNNSGEKEEVTGSYLLKNAAK